MIWVSNLKNFLNCNIPARLFLYAMMLLVPVLFYCELDYKHDIPILDKLDAIDFLWVGFYSSLLMYWTCGKRKWEAVVITILLAVNVVPIAFYCFAFLMGGILGPFVIILSVLVPFAMPLMILMDGYIVFAALWILVVVVAVFIFWKVSQNW